MTHTAACLPISRVLALVGGLAVVAAFYMPWFASQSLLLSGDFLNEVLSTASPSQLRQFLPSASPSEVLLLRALVLAFPICGAIAAVASVVGGFVRSAALAASVLQGVCAVVVCFAWAAGVTRLPPNATFEVGLWLMLAGALVVLSGTALEVISTPRRSKGA